MRFDILREVLDGAAGKACITCSFQAEDMVVLRELLKVQPDIAVLFLDTGYHFADTLAYRDHMAKLWQLNLVNVQAKTSLAAHEVKNGAQYRRDPGACCHARKVAPLMSALADYDIWFTGLRREQSPSRANLQVVETHHLPGGKALTKVSPLADWSWQDVQNYLWSFEVETLSLYDKGYLSIGCAPCTSLPTDAAN
ncbi:MAG: phosphoadenylyl-sulfate reductase, partial [Rhizomicrobium sp.]